MTNPTWSVTVGDCREVMAGIADGSINATVTDPPYHLTQASRGGSPRTAGTGPFGRHRVGEKGFMGKTWDGGGVAASGRTKEDAARDAGYPVNVWIDDAPYSVHTALVYRGCEEAA